MATSAFTTQPLPSLDQGQASRGLAGNLNAPALPSISTLTIGSNRPAMPSLSPAPAAPKAATPSSAYTVAAGDTLSAIAAKNGMSLASLLDANPQYKTNPNLIKPGQTVNFGTKATPATPTVSLHPDIATPSGATVNPSTGGLVKPPAGGAAPVTPAPFTPDPAVIAKMAATLKASGTGAATGDNTPAPTTPATPATPDLTALQEKDAAALKAYTESQNMSPEELAIQEQENALEASYTGAYQTTGHQPIPLEFITGQQKNLQEQKTNLEAPLIARAALLQAKRTAATTASKFALDRADAAITSAKTDAKDAQDRKDKLNETVSVAPGGTLVNKSTGKTVFGAPAAADNFTLSEGQKRYDANGKLIAEGAPKSDTQVIGGYLYEKQSDGTYKKVAGEGTIPAGGTIVKINGIDYQKNADGTYTQPDLPQLKAQASELKTNALTSAKDLLAKFEKNQWAVGKSSVLPIMPGTAASDFVVTFDNLKSLLSLDNVKLLKGQGQVSDAERKLLEDASAKLSRSQTEAEFKTQLDNIIKGLSGVGDAGTSYTTPDGTQYEQHSDGLYYPKANGGAGNAVSAKSLAEAVGKYESGGNYGAIGPVTSSGDKAYGKYQVMGNNISSWTKEVLGKSMTPQQFLKDQAAQDKVAEAKLGQYLTKYGNPQDAASAWFSGGPLSTNMGKKDVLGTTVPDYIKNIMKNLA